MKYHSVFYTLLLYLLVSDLLPVVATSSSGEERDVEKILDSRYRGAARNLQYLIQWIGPYPNTWEPASTVTGMAEALRKYCELYPNKPGC